SWYRPAGRRTAAIGSVFQTRIRAGHSATPWQPRCGRLPRAITFASSVGMDGAGPSASFEERGSAVKRTIAVTLATIGLVMGSMGLVAPASATSPGAKAPSPREAMGMAYDAAHGQVVLFGGDNPNGLGGTWTWYGTT